MKKNHQNNQVDFWRQLQDANQDYLATSLEWLRLILHRRILWLRQQWRHNPLQNFQMQVISDDQADWLLSSEDVSAELRFYQEDSSAKHISHDILNLKQKMVKNSQTFSTSNSGLPLDVLSQIFGLTSFDRVILLLCLAPEIDSSFDRLYAYIQDDISRKYVTPSLVKSLFKTDKDFSLNMLSSFLPESPLFRFKLIEQKDANFFTGSWNSCPLQINARVASYLQGINRLDEKIGQFLNPIFCDSLLPSSYKEILIKLKNIFNLKKESTALQPMNFIGSANARKKNIAAEFCKYLGIELFDVDLPLMQTSDIRLQDILIILERECMLLPAVLFFESSTIPDTTDSSKLMLNTLVDKLRTFFILSSDNPWQGEQNLFIVDIPKLSKQEQAILWNQELKNKKMHLNGEIDSIVEQFDLEADVIKKCVSDISLNRQASPHKSQKVSVETLWLGCRERSQTDLDRLAQRIEPCFIWDDIVAPEETLLQLKDIAAQVKHRRLVYETWGYGQKLSRGRGISALFSGASGTGKTMAAEIIANHLQLDLFRIDLSAVVSKYIGETEKNLCKVFDAAERSGAILFFDEADALFGKRSEVKDSHDRYANIEINYLLQRMEDYRGLAILATNMKSLLDPAFLRRLRFHVEFPFPDNEHRKQIWQKVFPKQAKFRNIDHNFLSRLEIPGANIKSISLNAAFLAANDGQVIEMNHILCAAKREYVKIGKVILEAEFGPYFEKVKE